MNCFLYISLLTSLCEVIFLVRVCQYAQHRQFMLKQYFLVRFRSLSVSLHTCDYSFSDGLPTGYILCIHVEELQPITFLYRSLCLNQITLSLSFFNKADCYSLKVLSLLYMDFMGAVIDKYTLCKFYERLSIELYSHMIQAEPSLVCD